MSRTWVAAAIVAAAVAAAGGTGFLISQANTPTLSPARLVNYESTPESPDVIAVAVLIGRLDSIGSAGAQVDASSVRITVRLLHWRGSAPADLQIVYVPIYLGVPLGDRSVLDTAGQAIPLRKR